MEDTTKKNPPAKMSSNEIVQVDNSLVQFDPEQDIVRGQSAAKALMKVIEITKPLKLGGKTYLYFEHWQTIAKFFGMTVGIEWTKQTPTGWEAKSVVYQNGVIIGGAEASCNKDEMNWKSKPDFQLKSMAQTRAAGKGLRNILGYVPVLAGLEATPAEEMDNGSTRMANAPVMPKFERTQPLATDYECPVHGKTVSLRPTGTTKQGKAYPAFYACNEKVEGKFCKERPEKVIQIEEVSIGTAPESSIDKARRILNASVPKAPYNYPEGD